MNKLQTTQLTDTWIPATWEEYLHLVENPIYAHASCYYHNGKLRIEMSPLGHDHACDNTIVSFAVNLFCTLNGIALKGLMNCTYRKVGMEDCQPDLSYYIGADVQAVPWGTRIIHLDRYPLPALFIEISDTSLTDDREEKLRQYEQLGVREYWIVDVKNVQILAFAILNGASRRIARSQVLPGLDMAVLTEALARSRRMDQSQVGAWLLAQFQSAQ